MPIPRKPSRTIPRTIPPGVKPAANKPGKDMIVRARAHAASDNARRFMHSARGTR